MDDSEKVKKTKEILQEWVDKQGHDRCWYYPDLFIKLAEILDVKPSKEPKLPPLDEFKKGCERYQREEYNG
jgi:hypothetical protein